MKLTRSFGPPLHPRPLNQVSALAHRLPMDAPDNSGKIKQQQSTRTQHRGESTLTRSPSTSSSTTMHSSKRTSTSTTSDEQHPLPSLRPQTANIIQKGVGFQRKTTIYLIPPLSEYTDEEIDACWIGGEDTKISHDELTSTIMLCRQNNGSIPGDRQDDLTTRGIEHLCTQAAIERRKAIRQTHINSVLDEQDDQWDKHAATVDQAHAIQEVSSTLSSQAINEAIARAAQDEAFSRRRP